MRGLIALAATAALVLCGVASAAAPPTLHVAVHGGGKVVGAAGSIGCPAKCAASPKAGSSVTLVAVPSAGSAFSHWSGACTGKTLRCTVKIAGPKIAAAWFVRKPTAKPTPPPPPPAPAPAPGFNPALAAGTWHGTYTDQTFGSNGTIALTVTLGGANAFTFALTMTGFPGGCAPGSSDINQLITPGTGPNQWNPGGFRVDETYPKGGSVHGTFDFNTGHLTASGSPDCNTSETWTLDGTLTGTTFNGNMTVIVDPQTTVKIVVTLTRD